MTCISALLIEKCQVHAIAVADKNNNAEISREQQRQNIVPIIRINLIIAFNWCVDFVVSCFSSLFTASSSLLSCVLQLFPLP